jgi:hypothetical protein
MLWYLRQQSVARRMDSSGSLHKPVEPVVSSDSWTQETLACGLNPPRALNDQSTKWSLISYLKESSPVARISS